MLRDQTQHASLVACRRIYFKMQKDLAKMRMVQNSECSSQNRCNTPTLVSSESPNLEESSQSDRIHQSTSQEFGASIDFGIQGSNSPLLEQSESSTFEPIAPDISPNKDTDGADERLRKMLRQIFVKHSVGRTHGNELLEALRQCGHNIPTTVDAILDTKGSEGEIRTMGNGEYLFIGLEKILQKVQQNSVAADQATILEDIEIEWSSLI